MAISGIRRSLDVVFVVTPYLGGLRDSNEFIKISHAFSKNQTNLAWILTNSREIYRRSGNFSCILSSSAVTSHQRRSDFRRAKQIVWCRAASSSSAHASSLAPARSCQLGRYQLGRRRSALLQNRSKRMRNLRHLAFELAPRCAGSSRFTRSNPHGGMYKSPSKQRDFSLAKFLPHACLPLLRFFLPLTHAEQRHLHICAAFVRCGRCRYATR